MSRYPVFRDDLVDQTAFEDDGRIHFSLGMIAVFFLLFMLVVFFTVGVFSYNSRFQDEASSKVDSYTLKETWVCKNGFPEDCVSGVTKELAPTVKNGEFFVLSSVSTTTACRAVPDSEVLDCKVTSEVNRRVDR